MNRKEELLRQQKELENQLEPIKEELRNIYRQEAEDVEAKIKRAHTLQDKFLADELVFAATARCECGAGMAYPKNTGIHGNWDCSAILLGEADSKLPHSGQLPFAFYSIKSENQPSANGMTTRANPPQ
jgi:hypothetical protein